MAHYLVTGGAGFIGSHLPKNWSGAAIRVRVADSLITGKRSNLDHISQVSSSSKGTSPTSISRASAVEGCDYVLHQAAIPSVPRSVKDPLTSNRANVDGTLNVLLASRDAGVKRLVFAASSSAYGDTPTLPKHEDDADQPAVALRPAEGDRRAVSADVHAALRAGDGRIRYFNVFGPRQDPTSPYSGVISVFATALLEKRSPTIYGDGEQTRDFTYVANVVDGVLRACEAPGASGRNHQRGDRRPDLAEPAVRGDAQARRRRRRSRSTPQRARGRARLAGRHPEGRRLLGYEPIVTFEEGLRKTVDWYRTAGAAATA